MPRLVGTPSALYRGSSWPSLASTDTCVCPQGGEARVPAGPAAPPRVRYTQPDQRLCGGTSHRHPGATQQGQGGVPEGEADQSMACSKAAGVSAVSSGHHITPQRLHHAVTRAREGVRALAAPCPLSECHLPYMLIFTSQLYMDRDLRCAE